jgi:DNA invertase Pin-like site-specific DNA recombinase
MTMDQSSTVRGYIRVSTDEQAASGYSLPAQREALQAYALSQGWEMAATYSDDGWSAKDIQRPALQALLRDLQSGEIVLVHKLDRLTRSIVDLHELIRLLDRRGAMFRSATEGFLDTTDSRGRLMLNFLGVLSQWERENIIERTTFGKRKKAQLGEWGGGKAPVGYRLAPGPSPEGGRAVRALCRLVPDPAYAHLIPLLFERYLAGHGVRGICRWLNDELGARTPAGRRFTDAAVSRILRNPIYCGDIAYGVKRGDPQRALGAHEPLVERALFDCVQATFTTRRETAPRRAGGAYPLTGVARCGVCGGAIDGRRKGARHYYLCHGYARARGCGAEPLTSFPGPLAEELVIRALRRLPAPPGLETFIAAWREARGRTEPKSDAEAERIRRDLATAELAVRQWKAGLEKGQLSWEEFFAETAPHRERIAVLKAQSAFRETETPPPAEEAPIAAADVTLAAAWEGYTGDPRARKALLQHLVRAWGLRILLGPGRRVRVVASAGDDERPSGRKSPLPAPAGRRSGRSPASGRGAG